MDRDELIQLIKEDRLIAIMRGIYGDDAVRTAEALAEGGITLMEVPFDQSRGEDQENTLDAIRRISELGCGIHAGAGTVMTVEQVQWASDAGSEYMITPNMDADVIRKTRELGRVMISGALTPSEIADAWKYGSDFVKVFPAGNMGSAYIKAVRAPLKHIPLMAVGGVNENNLKEFLDAGVCGFGIGGNLVNAEWIRAGAFEKITALARVYRERLIEALQ
ncbi:MAG: bifunctional 4-hydroxy-2-oxoglutarate aldolase/2-dehydro-3-deoxy-phosphogluconate aldolase [Lachnospiraceae bacterium]|nr:bifunctional 4-hydroxy-2-oxoglutarate aldolase/2-dehydro-3-deoxy-phosphogluconate aldolase [Lachnospiraceae bacterium]